MANMDAGFLKKVHFHPRQTGYRNELMLSKNRHMRIDDQRKEYPDPKRFSKRL